MNTKHIAIVGCGHAGEIRARALTGCRIVACCDVRAERAAKIAGGDTDIQVSTDWRSIIGRSDVDLIIVSTPHHLLTPIALAALREGKNVLIEKPAGIDEREIESLAEAAERFRVLVRVGFNHRYHPAICKAKDLCDANVLGELIGVRARYGHGAFPGFDREWRVRREHSGGGVLIDVGVHLIDLSRYFLGEITEVLGCCQTLHWKIAVEDNGYLILKTGAGKIAFLHASWTEWKPLFSFEVSGVLGSVEVSGLGRKYGKERLIHYAKSAASEENCGVCYEFANDDSWEIEIKEFLKDIELRRSPAPGLSDAKAALRVVRSVYGREAAAADHRNPK